MTWVFFVLIYIQKAPQLAQIKLQKWSRGRAQVSNNNCNAAMLSKILNNHTIQTITNYLDQLSKALQLKEHYQLQRQFF